MTYNQKHKETEIIETIKMLLPTHPELKTEIQRASIDLTKYVPEEPITFSTATNLYDIPDDNAVIMRYMDYDKFKYLIEKKALYMPIPKCFAQDSNEGYLIPSVGKFIDDVLDKIYKQFYFDIKLGKINVSGLKFTGIEAVDKQLMKDKCSQIYKHNLKRFFISCWTERAIDQDNMWKAYISHEKLKTAVAIKTTVGKLKNALKENKGLFAITRVKYVDLDSHIIKDIDFLSGGMWALACYMLKLKDIHYEDDKEIRLISDNLMTNRTNWYKTGVMTVLGIENFDYNGEPDYTVFNAPLVLDNFIDEIIVSPSADNEFIEELNKFLESKGLQRVIIKKSTINSKREFYWDK